MKEKELVVESNGEETKSSNFIKKIGNLISKLIKKINWKRTAFIAIFFLFCYFISELLNGNNVGFRKIFFFTSTWKERWDSTTNSFDDFFKFPKFVVNYLLFIFIYWIIYGLTNRTKLSCGLIAIFTFLFGIVNYIVTDLRGISITISDIYSIRTAANVAKGIKPTFEGNFIIATLMLIFIFIFLGTSKSIKDKKEKRTTKAKAITIVLGVVRISCIIWT